MSAKPTRRNGHQIWTPRRGSPKHELSLNKGFICLQKPITEHMQYNFWVFTSKTYTKEEFNVIRAEWELLPEWSLPMTIRSTNHGQRVGACLQIKSLKQCNITTSLEQIEELNFYTQCDKPDGRGPSQRPVYTWQCEFWSLHIWKRPKLEPY